MFCSIKEGHFNLKYKHYAKINVFVKLFFRASFILLLYFCGIITETIFYVNLFSHEIYFLKYIKL